MSAATGGLAQCGRLAPPLPLFAFTTRLTSMWSSPFFLSLASVFTLIGLTLVSVAVLTDNWNEVQVNRREIINAFKREPELNVKLQNAFGHNILYFSRTYGLLNVCFPDTVPQEIGSFTKFGSPCIWNNEFTPTEAKREHFTSAEWYRLYAYRGSIVCYAAGIAIVAISLISGIFGCWNRSRKLIVVTSVLLLVASLAMSLAMFGWHYVAYTDRNVLDMEPYYKSWEPVLKLTTRQNYGWSYFVSWIGIVFLLLGSASMYFAYTAIKKEEDMALSAKNGAYLMPNYYDKGAIVPYGYGTYAGYGTYPYYTQYNTAGYYGYMTYGR
ncbi:unnamed protein product [Caenorhabditis auriculariae]|uniref:Uncharacterized protein n=1 Tax=Caenorhabditis auriculariae TaxID=2777116 RepID=A0A8S1HD73_9PELO|nr:unnamed protein product [Caenorhabditis auriculariae]